MLIDVWNPRFVFWQVWEIFGNESILSIKAFKDRFMRLSIYRISRYAISTWHSWQDDQWYYEIHDSWFMNLESAYLSYTSTQCVMKNQDYWLHFFSLIVLHRLLHKAETSLVSKYIHQLKPLNFILSAIQFDFLLLNKYLCKPIIDHLLGQALMIYLSHSQPHPSWHNHHSKSKIHKRMFNLYDYI